MKYQIKLVRVYELEDSIMGARILVDKLWPRGISKQDLQPFYWVKEMTPSTDLRQWFDHKAERFPDFKEKYLKELEQNQSGEAFIKRITDLLDEQDVILLYGAKDPEINHAVILKEWLEKKIENNK